MTDKPIYIDIRPWGSMSTIIAHNFLGKRLPQCNIATVYARKESPGADCCVNGQGPGCESTGSADYGNLLTAALGHRVKVGGPSLCPVRDDLEILEQTHGNENAATYRDAYNQMAGAKWQQLKAHDRKSGPPSF